MWGRDAKGRKQLGSVLNRVKQRLRQAAGSGAGIRRLEVLEHVVLCKYPPPSLKPTHSQ